MKNLILKLAHIFKYWRYKSISIKKISSLTSRISLVNDNYLNENLNEAIEILHAGNLKPEKNFIERYYSCNGNKNLLYICEYDYKYHIEPKLNNRRYAVMLGDKGLLDYHLSKIEGVDMNIIPLILLRNFDGDCYNYNYKKINCSDVEEQIDQANTQRIIFKENLDTGGGRGVSFFDKNGDSFFNNKGVSLKEYIADRSNFIIQKAIKQHSLLSKINSSSINTIRIITYRSVKDNSINIIQSFLRFGKEDSLYDNFDKGGGIVNINEFGCFDDKFLSNNGQLSDFLFKGKAIPEFSEIVKQASIIAQSSFFSRVLGFDFAVDHVSKINLLEINYGGINPEPTNILSGPLFDQFTDEVIEYCKEKSFDAVINGKINF